MTEKMLNDTINDLLRGHGAFLSVKQAKKIRRITRDELGLEIVISKRGRRDGMCVIRRVIDK